MKRRVLRAHSNKRCLRQLSASHQITPNAPFHILVDASFLRTVLLSFWTQHAPPSWKAALRRDRRKKQKKQQRQQQQSLEKGISASSTSAAAPAPRSFDIQQLPLTPFRFMTSVVVDAFSSMESSSSSPSSTRHHLQSTARKPHHQQQFVYICLPETEATLRRLQISMPPPTTAASPSSSASTGPAARFDEVPVEVVNSLLKDLRHMKLPSVGGSGKLSNEAKAIEAFTQHHFTEQQQQERAAVVAATTREENRIAAAAATTTSSSLQWYSCHSLFIATQSHDVRRRLPSRSALLRWTSRPDAVWVEQRDATYSYANTPSSSSAGGGLSSSSPPASLAAQPQLSRADIAFISHLSASTQISAMSPAMAKLKRQVGSGAEAQRGKRHRGEDARAPCPSASSSSAAGGDTSRTRRTDSADGRSAAAAPPKKRQRSAKGCNPLSMQKKKAREVFRAS